MPFMAGNDKAEGAYGDRITIRDAAATQIVLVQIAEDVDRRRANGLKFVDEVPDAPFVESARGDICIFVETGDRLRVASREAKGAIREHALGVAQMADEIGRASCRERG